MEAWSQRSWHDCHYFSFFIMYVGSMWRSGSFVLMERGAQNVVLVRYYFSFIFIYSWLSLSFLFFIIDMCRCASFKKFNHESGIKLMMLILITIMMMMMVKMRIIMMMMMMMIKTTMIMIIWKEVTLARARSCHRPCLELSASQRQHAIQTSKWRW